MLECVRITAHPENSNQLHKWLASHQMCYLNSPGMTGQPVPYATQTGPSNESSKSPFGIDPGFLAGWDKMEIFLAAYIALLYAGCSKQQPECL